MQLLSYISFLVLVFFQWNLFRILFLGDGMWLFLFSYLIKYIFKKCMALHDLPVVDDSIWHISGHTIDYGPLFWHKSIFSDIGVLCLLRALNLHQRVKPPSTGMWSKCYITLHYLFIFTSKDNCIPLCHLMINICSLWCSPLNQTSLPGNADDLTFNPIPSPLNHLLTSVCVCVCPCPSGVPGLWAAEEWTGPFQVPAGEGG